jgi:DNA topoisomerase-1
MTAMDLNAYLAEISKEAISAKDFRTLYASAVAVLRLSELPPPKSKTSLRRSVTAVAREISAHLVNTPTIVRKSYIHPRIITDYESGKFPRLLSPSALRNCSTAEGLLCSYLTAL